MYISVSLLKNERCGGGSNVAFFCSKYIFAPSGSLLLPLREMVGTQHLAGCLGASGPPDEKFSLSPFLKFQSKYLFACTIKIFICEPFFVLGHVCNRNTRRKFSRDRQWELFELAWESRAGIYFQCAVVGGMRAVKLLLEEDRDPAELHLIPHSADGIIYYTGRRVFNLCRATTCNQQNQTIPTPGPQQRAVKKGRGSVRIRQCQSSNCPFTNISCTKWIKLHNHKQFSHWALGLT